MNRWYRLAEGKAPTSIALLVPGLNLHPDRLEPLALLLNSAGLSVLRVGLSAASAARGGATRMKWITELLEAYRQARIEAARFDVPVDLVAFSMGATLYLDLMNGASAEREVRFERMVLLAPALAVRKRFRPFQWVCKLPADFTLPSLSPRDYRANVKGTTVSAYRALFESIVVTRYCGLRRSNVPTLVLLEPRDELVSPHGLLEVLEREELTEWFVEPVSTTGATVRPRRHHLIVDEASLGTEEWKRVSELIRFHLEVSGEDDAATHAVPINRELFDRLLEGILEKLPEKVRSLLDEVPLIVEDEPSRKVLRDFGITGARAKRGQADLCGLHWGVPLSSRSFFETGGVADHILIFRGPIFRLAEPDEAELQNQIRITLLHELGHHFGLDEDELHELGYG